MADELKDEPSDVTPEEDLNPDTEETAEEPLLVEEDVLPEAAFPVEAEMADLEPEVLDVATQSDVNNLDLLLDIGLQVTVELGRKDMKFAEILELGKGAIVELNKLADEPVDIYVNQSKIAEGEVVVVDEHFGVRVTNLLDKDALRKRG